MDDPLSVIPRIATKLNTIWLRYTYPFAEFGRGVSIHYSCDIRRPISPGISIGDDVYIAPDVWLNIAPGTTSAEPRIVIGSKCGIGKRCMISALNRIEIEPNVLFAPSVLIMDHKHEFADINRPIWEQGVSGCGRVIVERNCWLGYGAAIVSGDSELRLGRNCVVGANAVVTRSFPPFTVVAGNPARIVKTFDKSSGRWMRQSQ
jgi:acetyltransferase-like isoleucine patch superfamily enzyme